LTNISHITSLSLSLSSGSFFDRRHDRVASQLSITVSTRNKTAQKLEDTQSEAVQSLKTLNQAQEALVKIATAIDTMTDLANLGKKTKH
jgi:ABC-type transporter Mla subunit MlaD